MYRGGAWQLHPSVPLMNSVWPRCADAASEDVRFQKDIRAGQPIARPVSFPPAVAAGMVDKLGSRVDFGTRVAELAGEDPWDDHPGSFAATELAPYFEDAVHSLRGEPNVIDIRNIGLMGAVELAPRDGAVGARGFDAHCKAFFEEDLLVRFTGDILAMSPPLIVSTSQIDEIVERLRRVLERVE